MRILRGRGETFDGNAVTADGLDERFQVRRGRHHRDAAAAPGGSGDQENNRDDDPAHSYFLTKIDFGTMQWTPLRMSTTWLTRQSPTIDVSA
jgi:hypothetical protein